MSCVGCDFTLKRFLITQVNTLQSMKEFLVSHGVMSEAVKCSSCNTKCYLQITGTGQFAFRCSRRHGKRRCHFYKSARTDTFVGGSRITVEQILTFCAFWCLLPKPRHATLLAEAEITHRTVVDWSNYCREVCLGWVYEHSRPIGGPGTIVEIDGSKFESIKLNGRLVKQGRWVFGAVERGNVRNFFVVPVDNRNAENLIDLIKQWILPQTVILSDCWKAYNILENEGFHHLRANHSVEFVNTADNGEIHLENLNHLVSWDTQNIQGKSLSLKYSLPIFGRKKLYFEGYFAEHIFKLNFPRSRLICEFFKRAALLCPPH